MTSYDVSRSWAKSPQGGVRWVGLLYCPKTNCDCVQSKTHSGPLLFVDLWNGKRLERQVAPLRVKPRASGLSCQCSATELQHPLTITPTSCPYNLLEVIILMNCMQLLCVELMLADHEQLHSKDCVLDWMWSQLATIGLQTIEESRPLDSYLLWFFLSLEVRAN